MVSVIIVNYNTSALLLDCVASVKQKVCGVDYEIVVVDNHSAEEERSMLRNDERFTLIELPVNVGFGRANNAGAEVARGDMLFLLNPDTLLVNDAVTILSRYLSEHGHVGICGGNLYDRNMQPAHSFHRLFPSILSEMDFAAGQLYRRCRYGRSAQFNAVGTPVPVAMITGADMMIRRDVWDSLGGFDKDFFMYCEDADLCYRCARAGYGVVSVPDARIIHLEGKSFHETEGHCRRVLEGRFTFFSKHYSARYNRIANLLNVATLWFAVTLCRLCRRGGAAAVYGQRLRIYRFLQQNGNFCVNKENTRP